MKDSQKISVIKDFIKFAYNELSIKKAPKVRLTNDVKFARTNHSFGGYIPTDYNLIVYIKNRNAGDILRTIAHELVHHKQNETNKINSKDGKTGSEIENEANAVAGVLLRKYGAMNPLIYESAAINFLLEDIQKYQIYCDMDGVLCDFPAQFEHFTGESPDAYYEKRGKIAFENVINEAGKDFWSNMPWTSTGRDLWSKIGKYGVIILSAPGNYNGAEEGKKEWIKKNLSPAPKNSIFSYKTKHKHEILNTMSEEERSKSVLIDDYKKNLEPWKAEGGIAIKYTGSENPSDTLEIIKGQK